MSNCIYEGDIGTIFRVRILDCDTGDVIDLSSVTLKQIIFKDPLGAIMTKTAVFTTDGIDGYIEYAVIAGDLSIAGNWSLQGYVESAGFKNSSSVSSFFVNEKLD